MPKRARTSAGSCTIGRPFNAIVPASGRTSPASCAISVVFPAPFGPMIASVSPAARSKSSCR